MGWDDQIKIFKQLTEFTYNLKMDEEGVIECSDEVFKQLTKFTYDLRTDEEDEMG